MPKTDASFDPEAYAPVADRITLFYARYPEGRILTELVSHTESEVVFKAVVYRSPAERKPAASGWAAEKIGDGDINTVACLENTETSAVGRALANLGLTAARTRPSLEEMEKAARARDRIAQRFARDTASRTSSSPPLRRVKEAPAEAYDALQAAADTVLDAIQLVAEAERSGMPHERAEELRRRLKAPEVEKSTIEQMERLLRRWLSRRPRSGLPLPPAPRDERPQPPF